MSLACPGACSFSVASKLRLYRASARLTVALGLSVAVARPSLPQATVRLAIVVLLSLSRLAVALLTVRLIVLLSIDWQLS